MKHTRRHTPFLLASILLLGFILSPLARAQSVKLDSLWGKIVGNVNAMLFSPDSKQLLIADDVGLIRVFDALSGEQRDSLPNRYGCTDMKLSPDGSLLFVANRDGVDIISTTTWKAVDSLPLPQLNGSELGHFYFDMSPDGKYLLIKKFLAGEVNTNDYYRMWVYSYPTKEQLWQKDVIAYDVKAKYGFPTGKIVFSSDGRYIMGEEGFSLKQWQWQSNDQTGEVLVDALPIRRENDLLAFSQDRLYCVFKSNIVYDIVAKKALIIEGIGGYSDFDRDACFMFDGSILVCHGDRVAKFVNIQKSSIVLNTGRGAGRMVTSPNNTYYVQQAVGAKLILFRLEKLTDVDFNPEKFTISIFPLPSNEQTSITITTPALVPLCWLSVVDAKGLLVQEVYQGSLQTGKNVFSLDNRLLSSGSYFLNLRYGSSLITQPFIITK